MKTLLQTSVLLAGLALAAFNATAATRTWNGDAISNDFWSDNDNWTGNNQPGAGDIVVFPAGIQASDRGTVNTILGSPIFNRLDFFDDYTVAGNRVHLNGGIRIGAGASATFNGAGLKLWANQSFVLTYPSLFLLDSGDDIDLNGRTLTFAAATPATNSSSLPTVRLNGRLTGAGSINVQDVSVSLFKDNDYTGTTTIGPFARVGLGPYGISFQNLGTLGSSSGGTLLYGQLDILQESDQTIAEPFTMYPGSGLSTIDIFSDPGSLTLSGPITLAGPGSMKISTDWRPGYPLRLTGRISGTGDLTFQGPGEIILAGSQSNSFAGTLLLSDGTLTIDKNPGLFHSALSCSNITVGLVSGSTATLRLNQPNQIINTASLLVRRSGVFDANHETQRFHTLTLEGGTVLGFSTSSNALTVVSNITSLASGFPATVSGGIRFEASPAFVHVEDGSANDDLSFTGPVDFSAMFFGRLRKNGPGKARFTSLQSALLEVEDGVTEVLGTDAPVRLNGGTLTGSGSWQSITVRLDNGSLAGSGRLRPGNSIINLGAQQGVELNTNVVVELVVSGTAPGAGHDQIRINSSNGSINLGGAQLELSAPGFGAPIGSELVVIENNSPNAVQGQFAGLTNGAAIATSDGARFTIHYDGGDGNDVTLRTTFVPPTGVTRLWSGLAAGSLWSAAGNWNPTTVPKPGDNLLFSTSTDKTITNDLPVLTPFNGLTVSSSGYTIRGNAFAVSGPLIASSAGAPLRFEAAMQLTTNVTFTANSNTVVQFQIAAGDSLELQAHTLTLDPVTASSRFEFLPGGHALTGTGALIKRGPGTVILSNAATAYVGSVTVAQGTLSIQANSALGGAGTGNTTISNGAVLEVVGATTVTLQEQVAFRAGATVRSTGAAHTLLGDASLGAGEQTIEVPDGSLNFFAAVSGVGGLRKTGAGELLLTGDAANTATGLLRVQAGTVTLAKGAGTNAWAGSVDVSGGSLRLISDNQIPANVSVTVRGPGLLDLNGRNESLLGGLFMQGGAVQTGAGFLTLDGDLSTIASSNSATIAGQFFAVGARQWTITEGAAADDLVVNSTVAGTSLSSVRKTGGGRVVFAANNTLPVVQLDAGTALFNGSNITRVDLNGGTLGGTGRVANLTSLAGGGIVAPGLSLGILTVSNVSWNAATTFSPEIRTATPGTGHDQLRVFGTINLGGAALDVTVLSNFTATVSDTLVLIDNDSTDAITGTFAGLAEGATFTEAELGTGTPRTFRISYVGGAGSNDVTLKLVVLGTGITRTWDGGGTNNNWSVTTNWDGNVTAPAPGDALVFPAGAARLLNTNNLAAGTGFDSLAIRATGYTLRGNRVSLIQGLVFDFSGSSTLNLPITLTQPQSFTAVNGAFGTVSPLGAGASLDNAGFTLTLHADTALSRVDISGLTGSGALLKTGPGVSALTVNSHSGLTTISEGSALLAAAGDGLGTAAAGTIVNAGASLTFSLVTAPTLAEPFTLAGTLQFITSPVALTGPLTLPNGALATFDVSGTTPFLRGIISGNGAFQKTGAGELALDGTAANTFTGGTTIAGGVLRLQKTAGLTALRGPVFIDGTLGAAELRLANAHQILDSASLTLDGAGALFNLNNRDEDVNDLTFAAGAVQTGTGVLTLAGGLATLADTDSASLDGTVSVADLAVWNVEDGPVANDLVVSAIITAREASTLVKAGAGRVVFAGNNTLPFLRIDEGDAAITRDSSATVVLLNGGTLSGDGIIGGISNLVAGGIIAPGASPGTLTSTGAVTLIERTVFAVELLNATPGTGYDQLVVGGAVDLGFAELSVTLLPGFTPAQGQSFTILDNQGRDNVVNEFFGLAEGKELDLGPVRFRISYKGGDGNDVVLTTSLVTGTGITNRWDGGAGVGDPKWTTAANWEGDLAPVQGNALVFPTGPAQRSATNDFPAGTTFAALTFEGGGYALTGNRVVLNDGVVVSAPSNEAGVAISLPLKLAQNQTFNTTTNALILTGGLDTDGRTVTLRVETTGECTVSNAPVSGTGGVTKTGPGQLFLSGSNTFTGTTLLQGGRTVVGSPGALGGAGGTTIQAAELELRSAVAMTITEPLTLTSTSSLLLTTNSLVVTTNPHALTGTITLSGTGAREVRVGSRAGLTLDGRISGAGTLRKTDTGTLLLGGSLANTFTGGTVVEGGTLALSKTTSNAIPGALTLGTAGVQTFVSLLSSNQIADAAIVTVRGNSSISFGPFADLIGGLVLQNSTASTDPTGLLTINGNVQCLATPPTNVLSVASTISGRVQVTGGVRTWSVENGLFPEALLIDATVSTGPGASLLKTGAGTLHFLKPTTISQVQIDTGSALFDLANPGTLIQLNGGLLGGAGTVSHVTALAGGGTVAPGLAIGELTTAILIWNAATTYRCEFNGLIAGADHDRINALGQVTLGGAALDLTLGFTPALNDTIALLLNESGSGINGTFAGLPEGALFATNGVIFRISYVGATAAGTDGNDVQITRVAAPPSLLSGLTTLPNGLAQFTGTGVPGADYLIEASTDLITWQPIASVTAGANGLFQFIDADSLAFPHRFYRALSP